MMYVLEWGLSMLGAFDPEYKITNFENMLRA